MNRNERMHAALDRLIEEAERKDFNLDDIDVKLVSMRVYDEPIEVTFEGKVSIAQQEVTVLEQLRAEITSNKGEDAEIEETTYRLEVWHDGINKVNKEEVIE